MRYWPLLIVTLLVSSQGGADELKGVAGATGKASDCVPPRACAATAGPAPATAANEAELRRLVAQLEEQCSNNGEEPWLYLASLFSGHHPDAPHWIDIPRAVRYVEQACEHGRFAPRGALT